MIRSLFMAFGVCLVFLAGYGVAADYVIGEGDQLSVDVWGVETLSASVRVRPDGKITIPALGEVTAAGRTPPELQELLTVKLKKFVKNPVVTVTVSEITNNRVFVFGGGVKSGVHSLDRRTTLLELLCQVGEMELASLHEAYLLRDGQKVKTGFYELFVEGRASQDVPVEPGDIIFIPGLEERNVYVVGAVNNPRYVRYREGLTLMEAVLEAEGFTKFAKKSRVVIYRSQGNDQKRLTVNVEDLLSEGDLSRNVSLRPGDYVVVKEGIF